MTSRGRFLVIEGIDGAGSSTQSSLLLEFVSSLVPKAVGTKEPTDGPAGAMLRLALSHRLNGPSSTAEAIRGQEPASSELDSRTMALLFAADRLDHATGLIEPMLSAGTSVVCDRYLLSSLAYQGLKVDHRWLLEINRHVPRPDVTIYLSSTVHHTQHRMKNRPRQELYESRSKQELIDEGYRQAIAANYELVGPVHVVRATKNAQSVAAEIRAIVKPLFEGGELSAEPRGSPSLFEAGGH